MKKKFIFTIFFFLFFYELILADEIKKISIEGNDRISNETIKMFAEIDIGNNITEDKELNDILNRLYKSNFFENVSVSFKSGLLSIIVTENPIIDQIIIEGVKSKTILKLITDNFSLKERSSYNEINLKNDILNLKASLKNLGYFFSEVNVDTVEVSNNLLNIIYKIELGEKAKIKKISFLGNKIFKDKKLLSLIVSEEYKIWKLLSNKKYVNFNSIELDERLLQNYYINKGYAKVEVKSSFARLLDSNNFELIYNIDAKKKYYFNNLTLSLPVDYNVNNFDKLIKLFSKVNGKPYSIDILNTILNEIELLALQEQYESISTKITEEIIDDKINLNFTIEDSEKIYVYRINIFGNNVTRENVIRNQFEIDEGDPFNEILYNKSINNIKNLNFFKTVNSQIIDDDFSKLKTINIEVEEKATGEIFAGAGVGTDGGSLSFGVKENNYLGKGISVDANLSLNADSIKGNFYVNNPNYQNSKKSLFMNIEASELDRLSSFGYKSNKTGFSFGTSFEYFQDLNLGISIDNFYEKITTDTTASLKQQSQKGNYFDSFLDLKFNLDKRNQKFETNDGFITSYAVDFPLISENYSLTNTFDYKIFSSLFENNRSTASFLIQSSNSLSGDNIKLSERLYIPGRRLRGFETGKIGPKDGTDFVGGNYGYALNFTTTIPQILENNQNLDFVLFMDAANLWGVDYDSSINNSGKIRSSFGLAIDWLTAVGPLNFSFAQPISKDDGDITESFRFNLGTTF